MQQETIWGYPGGQRIRRILVSVLAAMALGSGTVQAGVLWSNLPTTGGGQAGINTSGANAAMGFSVGAGPNYILDTLVLSLRNVAGDTPQVRLFSNVGNNPAVPLLNFANPAFAGNGLNDYEFTPVGNATLLAETSYWIVVQSIAGSFNWARNDPSTSPTGTFSYLGTRFNGDPPTRPANTFQYGIEIRGRVSSVPLPATASLLFVGLFGLLVRDRRPI